MPTRLLRAALAVVATAFAVTASPSAALAGPEPPPPPPLCEEDCFQLTHLTLRGSVTESLTFELEGSVRSREPQKIPIFGPPSQVRLDDLTQDGARPTVTFDNEQYYLITSARTFRLRGRITLGNDQMLTVPGPLLAVDAHLAKGRLVEGSKLSGVEHAILHFDPLSEGESAAIEARTPPVFRLARSIRFGTDAGFVYRLVASQSTELGTLKLPLAYGEKVQDVQGSTGWRVEGSELVMPTSGREAEITIAGSLPAQTTPRVFKADERCAYEWWMIEADPEHRVSTAGEAKLVETSQSPIPPTMPGARVYLVQRGQALEVDAQSLVRGDVLAAVARVNKRFVAVTGGGEIISDEAVSYDNNGLEHLMVGPAGRAMYLSTDGVAQRILHTESGARDIIVPARPGSHLLRLQSHSTTTLTPLAGALTVPTSSYPVATSAMDVVVGLPEHVHPLVVLGGDRVRSAGTRADLIAIAFGAAVACFGFRTRKTRALGALVTAGLWFVSREAFVFATGALFVAGAVFLASRFTQGMKLLAASAAFTVVALFAGRYALSEDAAIEPRREMIVSSPQIPTPESTHAVLAADGTLDTKAGVTPVSLSIPTSERYVQSSRQLVTKERPFVVRVFYVTSATLATLHVAWLVLAGLLAFLHRGLLSSWKKAIIDRVLRRPEPEAPPVLEPAPF